MEVKQFTNKCEISITTNCMETDHSGLEYGKFQNVSFFAENDILTKFGFLKLKFNFFPFLIIILLLA